MKYADLTPQELRKLRMIEEDMGIILIAYEGGYVSSTEKYIGDLHSSYGYSSKTE